MALSKKPTTGMKDILPEEMQIRDYVISVIKDTYGKFGFTSIETPCVENIANLSSKQGGDNEKLIFKILKRGEKLNIETAETENDLADGGLRYDLTLPLSRYYSNNSANLPSPFKALQMGNVWRADRPQRGRFRQFMQCDIDILGEPSNLAEIELILATTALLGKLDFKNFTIRINDRRFLKAMAAYSVSSLLMYRRVRGWLLPLACGYSSSCRASGVYWPFTRPEVPPNCASTLYKAGSSAAVEVIW